MRIKQEEIDANIRISNLEAEIGRVIYDFGKDMHVSEILQALNTVSARELKWLVRYDRGPWEDDYDEWQDRNRELHSLTIDELKAILKEKSTKIG